MKSSPDVISSHGICTTPERDKHVTRIENDIVSITPSHIKLPFDNLHSQVSAITIWNKTKNYIRFRVNLPQTDIFEIYCNQLGIFGNAEATVFVKCKPRGMQIIVDCLEINIPGQQGIRIPLEILPSIDWFVLPKFITLPPTSLDKRVEAIIHLPKPPGKVYPFTVVSPITSIFSVDPRHGNIGGPEGVNEIRVSFQAFEYVTIVYTLRIKFLGIESQPYEINICGRCVPNIEADKEAADVAGIASLVPELPTKPKKPQLPKSRFTLKHPNKDSHYHVDPGDLVKNSLDLFTPAGIMKFLSTKDYDPSTLLGPLGVELSKSQKIYLKKLEEFNTERFKYDMQQKNLALHRHREHIGEEPIEAHPDLLSHIKAEREQHHKEYQLALGMGDNESSDLARTVLQKTNQRSIRPAHQFQELKFNKGYDETEYLLDLYRVKRTILQPFINASRIIITRWRADHRLRKLRKLVAHRKAEIAAGKEEESVTSTTVDHASNQLEPYKCISRGEYPTKQEFDVERMRMKFRNQELKAQVDNLNAQLRAIRDSINGDLEKIKARVQGEYAEEEKLVEDSTGFRKFSHVQDMTTYLQQIDRAIQRLQEKIKSPALGSELRALTRYILILMGLITSEDGADAASRYLNKYMIFPPSPPTSPSTRHPTPVAPAPTAVKIIEKAASTPTIPTAPRRAPEISSASTSKIPDSISSKPATQVTIPIVSTTSPRPVFSRVAQSDTSKILDLEDAMGDVNHAIGGLHSLIHDQQLKNAQTRINNIAGQLYPKTGAMPDYFVKKYDTATTVQESPELKAVGTTPQELKELYEKVNGAIGRLQDKVNKPQVGALRASVGELLSGIPGFRSGMLAATFKAHTQSRDKLEPSQSREMTSEAPVQQGKEAIAQQGKEAVVQQGKEVIAQKGKEAIAQQGKEANRKRKATTAPKGKTTAQQQATPQSKDPQANPALQAMVTQINTEIENLQSKFKSRELDERQREFNKALDVKDYESTLEKQLRNSTKKASALPSAELEQHLDLINKSMNAIQSTVNDPRLDSTRQAINSELTSLLSASKRNLPKGKQEKELKSGQTSLISVAAAPLSLQAHRDTLNRELDALQNKISHPILPIHQKKMNVLLDTIVEGTEVETVQKENKMAQITRRMAAQELRKLEKMLESSEINAKRKELLKAVDAEVLKRTVPKSDTETTGLSSGYETDDSRQDFLQSYVNVRRNTPREIKAQLAKVNQRIAKIQDIAKSPKIGDHIAKINGLVEKALVDEPNDEDAVAADLKAAKEIIGRELVRLSTLVPPASSAVNFLRQQGQKIRKEIDRVTGADPAQDPEVHHSRKVLRAEMDVLKNRVHDLQGQLALQDLVDSVQEYSTKKPTARRPLAPSQINQLQEIQNKLNQVVLTPSQTDLLRRLNKNMAKIPDSEATEETRTDLKRDINRLQYSTNEPQVKILLADMNKSLDEDPGKAPQATASHVYKLFDQLTALVPKNPEVEKSTRKSKEAIDAFMHASTEMDQFADVARKLEQDQERLRSSIQEAQTLVQDESMKNILTDLQSKLEGQSLNIGDMKNLHRKLSEHFTRYLTSSSDPRLRLFVKKLQEASRKFDEDDEAMTRYGLAKQRLQERRESLFANLYGLRKAIPTESEARPIISQIVSSVGDASSIQEQVPSDVALARANEQRNKLNQLLKVPKYAADPMVQSALAIINEEVDRLLGESAKSWLASHRSEPTLPRGVITATPSIQKSESVPTDVYQSASHKGKGMSDRLADAIKMQLARVNVEIDALQKKIMNRTINDHHRHLNEVIHNLLGEPSDFKPWLITQDGVQIVPGGNVNYHRQRINDELDRLQQRAATINLSPIKAQLNATIDKALGGVPAQEAARLSALVVPKAKIPQKELEQHRRSIIDALIALMDAIPGFDRRGKERMIIDSINHLFAKMGIKPSGNDKNLEEELRNRRLQEHKLMTDLLFDAVGGDYDQLLRQYLTSSAEETESEREIARGHDYDDDDGTTESLQSRARKIRYSRLNRLQEKINAEYDKLQAKLKNIDVFKNQIKLNEIIDRLANRAPDDPNHFVPKQMTEVKPRKDIKITAKTLRKLHVGILIPLGSLQYQFPNEELKQVENELNAIMRNILKNYVPNISGKDIKNYMTRVRKNLERLKKKLPEFGEQANTLEGDVQNAMEGTLEEIGASSVDISATALSKAISDAGGTDADFDDKGFDGQIAGKKASGGEMVDEEDEMSTQEDDGLGETEDDDEEEGLKGQWGSKKTKEIEKIRLSINNLLNDLQQQTQDPNIPRHKSFFNQHLDKLLGIVTEPDKKDVIDVIGDVHLNLDAFKALLPNKRKETIGAIQRVLAELKKKYLELQSPPKTQEVDSKVNFPGGRGGGGGGGKGKKKGKKLWDKTLKKYISTSELAASSEQTVIGGSASAVNLDESNHILDGGTTSAQALQAVQAFQGSKKQQRMLKKIKSESSSRFRSASKITSPQTGPGFAKTAIIATAHKKLLKKVKATSKERMLAAAAAASDEEELDKFMLTDSLEQLEDVTDSTGALESDMLIGTGRRMKKKKIKKTGSKLSPRVDKLRMIRRRRRRPDEEEILGEDGTEDFDEELYGEDASDMSLVDDEQLMKFSREDLLAQQDRINRMLNGISESGILPAVDAVQERFNKEIIDILNSPGMSQMEGKDAKGIKSLLEVSQKIFEFQDMARSPEVDKPAVKLEHLIRQVAETADVQGPMPPLLPILELAENGHRLPVLVIREFRQKIARRFAKVPARLMNDEIKSQRDAIEGILKKMQDETPDDVIKNNLYKLNNEINLLQTKVTNADVAHYQDTLNAYVLYLLGMKFRPEFVNITKVSFKPPGDIPLAITPEQLMYHQKRIHCAFEGMPTYFKTAKLRGVFELMNDKVTMLIGIVKQNRAKSFIDRYNNEIDIIQRHIMHGDLARLQDLIIEEFQSILNWVDVRWTPFRDHTFTGVQLPRNVTQADTKKYKERLMIAYTDIPSDAKNVGTHDVHRKILSFLDNLGDRPASPEEYMVMETSELQERITTEIREIQNRMILQVHQLDSPDEKLDILKLNKFQWKVNMELNAVRDKIRYEIQRFYEKVKHHPRKIKYRRTHLRTIKALQENATVNMSNLQEVINQFIDQFRKRFADDAKEANRKRAKAQRKKGKGKRGRSGGRDPCSKFGLKCVRISGVRSSKSKSKTRCPTALCAAKIDSMDLFNREMAARFGISIPSASNTRTIDAWNVATEKKMRSSYDEINLSAVPSISNVNVTKKHFK